MDSYLKKYLKYKEKYLKLKQLGAGYIPYNEDQKTLHSILQRMDENFVITGMSCVYQWHFEDEEKNRLKTVTLMGEAHQNISDYHPASILPVDERGTQKRFTEGLFNSGYLTNRLEDQNRFLILEILWYLFKGTRRCIDFYLEDWKETLDFTIKKLDYNLSDFHNERRRLETINYLIDLIDTDIHLLPDRGLGRYPRGTDRKDYKKFDNLRAHYTEFRTYGTLIHYKILPYSIVVDRDRDSSTLYIRLNVSRENRRNYLRNIQEFLKILFCVNNPENLPGSSINRRLDNILIRRLNETLTLKYNEIIRLFRFTNIPEEINRYKELQTKILKNLWKCDTLTIKKFILFVDKMTNLTDYFDILEDRFINSEEIFKLLQNITTFSIDVYLLSRSLKTFNILNQDKNLKETSLCFNQPGISNRNILNYHGYAHTFLYYFFFRFYFGTIPNYSISVILKFDFNEFFSNYQENLRGDIINEELNEENLNQFVFKFLFYRDNEYPRKNNSFSSLNHVRKKYDPTIDRIYQAFKNELNIFKKILINISKEKEERLRLLKNVTSPIFTLEKYYKSLIKKNIDGWFTNYLNFTELNYNSFSTETGININLFENNRKPLIIYNQNVISKNDFYDITPVEPHRFKTTDFITELRPRENKFKLFLQSKLTDLIANHYNQSFESRAKFVKFLIDYINEALNLWHEKRTTFYRPRPDAAAIIFGDATAVLAEENIVKLLYKGGITLRLLIYSLKKQFTIKLEEEIERRFGDYLKISDNDFEFKINFTGIEERLHQPLINEISFLSFLIIRDLNDILNNKNYSNELFDFNNLEFGKIQEIMQNTLNELNSIPADVRPENISDRNPFEYLILNNKSMAPADRIDLINENYDLYDDNHPGVNPLIDPKTMKTSDLIKNHKEGRVMLYMTLPNIRKDEFLRNPDIISTIPEENKIKVVHSINEEIFLSELVKNLPRDRYNKNPKLYSGNYFISYNPNIVNKFSLARIKANFNIIGNYTDGNKFIISSDGEIVDLSLSRKNFEFLQDDDFKTYQVNLPAPNNFSYYSLSLKGHILDIFKILFFDSIKPNILNLYQRESERLDTNLIPLYLPWTDNKYEKRLNRLFILILLESLIKTGHNLDLILRNLRLLRDIPIPTTLDEIDIYYNNLKNLLVQYLGRTKFEGVTTRMTGLDRAIKFESEELSGDRRDVYIEIEETQLEELRYDLVPPILGRADSAGERDDLAGEVPRRSERYTLPRIDAPFITKYNSIRRINNLYGFIYFLIKFLAFYLQNRASWDDINFNEREGDQFKVLIFFSKIREQTRKIIEIVKKIQGTKVSRFPNLSTIDPKNFS